MELLWVIFTQHVNSAREKKNPLQLPYIPPNVDFPDDAAQQGDASWAADSTKAVFKKAVVGRGWHDDSSRYTTKNEKKYFIIK